MRKLKKVIASMMMASALLITGQAAFAETASASDASAVDAEAEEATFDPSGVYHAALGIQTCNTLWINRQAYFTDSLNETYGTDKNDTLWAGDASAAGTVYDGTFTDVEIKGNGTYTVKLEGADFADETAISQLYVATDIPYSDDLDIEVTDFTVNINGKDIVTFPETQFEDEDKYLEGGVVILAINHWRSELVQYLAGLGVVEDSTNGIDLLTGKGDETVTLTFTISGFDYDNEAADDETEENTESSVAEAAADDAADAATTESKTEDSKDGSSPIVPIIIVVVVIVVIVAVVAASKKKKK